MKLLIFILLVCNTWVFADVIDDQVSALQAQMQKALDVRNLNEENIQKKMKEISESLPPSDLSTLNQPIQNIEGMSQEELRRMDLLVKQELDKHGITKEDLNQLKKNISDLAQSQ